MSGGPTNLVLSVARCPICGQCGLEDAWRCARCETPHHDACARYFGGCAIYGCRDAALPQRLEVETWPAAARALDALARARRAQSACLAGLILTLGTSFFAVPVLMHFFRLFYDVGFRIAVWLARTAVFAFGPLFCVASLVAERRLRALRLCLHRDPDTGLDLRRFRALHERPAGRDCHPLYRAASVLCLATAIATVGHCGASAAALLVPALVMAAATVALSRYGSDHRTFAARVEAIHTPMLEEAPVKDTHTSAG